MTNSLEETSIRSNISLFLFLSLFRPDATSATFTLPPISSSPDNQAPNTTSLAAGHNLEGNNDAETSLDIAFPTPMEVYNTGDRRQSTIPSRSRKATKTNEPSRIWIGCISYSGSILSVFRKLSVSTSYGDDD